MYVCTCVPIMTTKLCPFYTEFGSFPYVFSSLSPIHALLISFVPFSSSLFYFELCRTNVSQPLRKRFHFNPARIHSKSQSVWAGILSWRRLSNFILQHFAVCLVVYDLRLLPRPSVASYFKNCSNKCICCCCCCLFSFFVCVRLLFAFSLRLCVSLSYGNSISLWVHSWAQCECGDGWSCPAGNQDVNRSLDCFRHVQGGGHIRCNNSAVASL